uniref:Uncharacterized protein n=1 Tax=Sphaerodactylus townsendi TaxID=933632 RepID=A0ACB8FMY3_9SAUR
MRYSGQQAGLMGSRHQRGRAKRQKRTGPRGKMRFPPPNYVAPAESLPKKPPKLCKRDGKTNPENGNCGRNQEENSGSRLSILFFFACMMSTRESKPEQMTEK